MNRIKIISVISIVSIVVILAWYLSITYALSFGIMNMIEFIYFHIPALICLTIGCILLIINLISKSIFSKIKIIVLTLVYLFSTSLFLVPNFINSFGTVAENKEFLNYLSIENSLKTDYVTKEEQYYNSVYEQNDFLGISYIYSSFKIGDTTLVNEELKDDSTEIEYSINYIKNVPSIIYIYWQKPAIFDLLYEKKARFGYSLEEEFEFKSNDDLVNYKVYYTEETDNKCKIVIYAENGQDMLIYHMKLDDDLRGLIIDKEHIVSLIEDVMSGTIK